MRRAIVTAAVVTLATSVHAGTPPSCPGCNVVLVTFDALRADRLGTYGHPKATSPHIDAIARRSTVFGRCVSQSATTVSAVPALLTGEFPVTDRLLDGLTLRADEDTMATILHRRGYRTLAVIGHTFAGCKYSRCADVDVVSDAPDGYEPTSTTVERALRMLETQLREPFFLWIHVRVPHAPYDAMPDEFARMYDDDDGPTWFAPDVARPDFFGTLGRLVALYRARGEPVETMRVVNGRRHETTPSAVRQIRVLYDANVRLGDEGFGRIVTSLKRRGLMKRSVVVVAADHGEALGERGVIGHNGLLYGMLWTPLIVYMPGRRGSRSDVPVMNVDVLPTVASIVGAALDRPVRGRNLFGSPPPEAVQYAEYVGRHVVIRGSHKLDVRTTTLPMLRRRPAVGPGDGPFQMIDETTSSILALWDVERDTGETINLTDELPDLARDLQRAGEALVADTITSGARPPAQNVLERLKALGYVEESTPEGR